MSNTPTAADVTPSPEGVTARDGDDPELPQAGIGWLRAIGSGVAILVVTLGITLFGTDWILAHLTSLSRDQRVWLSSALFLIVVVASAWALRRLQARGLI